MQLTNKILNILRSINGIKTVIHDTSFSTNVRLDRRETIAAIVFMLQEFNVNVKNGVKRESEEIEIFLCDRCDLAAKGEVVEGVLDGIKPVLNEFLTLVLNERSWVVDGDEINVKMSYGRFDCNVVGYSVELKLTERQGGCIDSDTSGVNQIVIKKNGTVDVAAYGEAIVNVVDGEIRLQDKTATTNGIVTFDEGYNGLQSVTVNVQAPAPEIRLQEKTTTTNGYITFDSGYDGLQGVSVNVPQPSGTLQRTITENGTETVDIANYQAIEITTNVPTGSTCNLETLNINCAPSELQPTYTPSGDGFDQVNINLHYSVKYEIYTLQTQYDSVQYDVRDNDYIYINLDAHNLPAQCYGDLPVTIASPGIEYVNCCGYNTVSINTTQIQGLNTWKGTWAQYQAIYPKDSDTLYLITD